MRRFISLCLIAACGVIAMAQRNAAPTQTSHKVPLPDTELQQLDKVLQETKRYDALKKNRIDSLQFLANKAAAGDVQKHWNLLMQIGDQFKVFSADSALNYYQQARKVAERSGNPDLVIRSRASIVRALSTAGIFTAASNELDSLENMVQNLPDPLKIDIYKAGRQLYSYMCAYIEGHEQYRDLYYNRFKDYNAKLLPLLADNDPFRRFILAEQYIDEGRYKDAKQLLEQLLREMPDHSNLYGMAAYQMAQVYHNQGDEAEAARYLALASISDIKGSVKEGLALPSLAQWLYEQGDIDRAYNYINESLEDAKVGNARMRTVAIAGFVSTIDDAYRSKISSSRDELMIYFLLVTVFLVISGVLLFFLIRQMKRLNRAKERLSATSKLQDSYIGNFLGMCSSYASRLESMNKLVVRKIAAGQTDELLKQMKSGKFAEEQTDDFMKIFDNAFLDLYPNFVDEINKLLRTDEQIVVKKGQGLPTELRIYAFVRLGVDESTKISRILRYSVSTVYTYRNKMRNKAIDRDTFESDVMKIGHN